MRSDDEFKVKRSRNKPPGQRVCQSIKKHKNERCKLRRDVIAKVHITYGVFSDEEPMTRQEVSERKVIDKMMLCTMKSNYNGGPTFSTGIIPEPDMLCEDMKNLYVCITPRQPLYVTAHKIIRCHIAEPCADMSIYRDLQRALNYPSTEMLKNIIQIIHNIILDTSDDDSRYPLASIQRSHLIDIWQKILTRTSYGILFISNGQVFTLKNTLRQHLPVTAQDYPMIQENGGLEGPWDVAIRKVYEEIEYREENTDQWCAYNIAEHHDHIQRYLYLECTVDHNVLRLMGLIVIRLARAIQLRPREPNVSQNTGEWIPLDADIDMNEYGTVYPFIEFIQNHPDL